MAEQPSAGVDRSAPTQSKAFDKTDVADELQKRLSAACPKKQGKVKPVLVFETVKEWAENGEWEDVFNVKEIKPFLKRAEP